MMAVLLMACATSSLANENLTEDYEMTGNTLLPVKKTTKKTTTKKSSTKTSTAKTVAATTSSTATSTTTDSSKSSSTLGNVLGSLLGGNSNSSNSTAGNIISGILDNVIGSASFKQSDLCAYTWKYKSPGCAFTSENLLAKAGGEVASKTIENKLSSIYQKAGFSASNTYVKFNEDGTFSSKIDGKSWSGTYTFDEKTHAIQLKGRLLLSISGFATRNTSGISLLFESKKLLTLVQTLTALSGNSTLSTIGEISKNYDGVRIGFDMSK